MADVIEVKAAVEDRKVVLWEKHPAHPTGEVWISGNGRTVKVARTAEVDKRLRTGVLIQVPYVQTRTVLSETSAQPKAAPKKQPKVDGDEA